jgi:hypothetical protein
MRFFFVDLGEQKREKGRERWRKEEGGKCSIDAFF